MLLYKSKRKYLLILLLIFGIAAGLFLVPDKWWKRMGTIANYEQEGAAMTRIETWKWSWGFAQERPLTGGGFGSFRAQPDTNRDAHSVYFGMLGEQGFLALGLFFTVVISSYMSLQAIIRSSKDIPWMRWFSGLARMLQISIAAFLVNGLTLNKQYFDLFYLLVAIVVIMKTVIKKEAARLAEEEGPFVENKFRAPHLVVR